VVVDELKRIYSELPEIEKLGDGEFCRRLTVDVTRLAFLVVERLSLGPVRHDVLARLASYLEYFERESLIEKLEG
jgi:hypothetical protein